MCYTQDVLRRYGTRVLLLLSLGIIAFPSFAENEPQVLRLIINDSIIGPVVSEYIQEGIEEAEKMGAAALLIALDTPGGLLNSTRTIVKNILGADVPIIVYVSPSGSRAGSAGVFITLAGHIAAMAPSTNIGAAHPVTVGGERPGQPKKEDRGLRDLLRRLGGGKEDKESKSEEKKAKKTKKPEASKVPMEEKILNDTIAWVTAIATERGRNAKWAVKAVVESASITEREALKKNVIDVIAKDEVELLAKIHGRKVKLATRTEVLNTKGAAIIDRPMSGRQNFLNILINPNIAYILMMLGFYGLLFEITHPGSWIPGVVGAICLILAFYAFQTIPTNFAGFALIGIAIILFIAEAFVPSFGLLTLGGIVSMVLGSLFLVDSPFELMQVSLVVILPVVGATAFVAVFLVSLVLRAQRQKKVTGLEDMIGDIATAETDLALEGKIFVKGEYWDADADQEVKKGEEVEVIAVEGMRLKVRKK